MKLKDEVEEIVFDLDGICGTVYATSVEISAGRLNFIAESPTKWVFEDLCVRDQATTPPSPIRNFLMLLRISKPRTINFRRRGIGTKLLKRLLNEADQRGVETIHGEITKDDLRHNPNLPNWYQKYGFNILPPNKSCRTNAAYRIRRYQPTKY